MEIYLDNAATTPCYPEVGDLICKIMCEEYGNPSSLHKKGMEAEGQIKTAKEEIAQILKVSSKEIYFTSGGTESDNLGVIGTAFANRRRGNHIITTVIEHSAVRTATEYLAEEGFEITYLPVDKQGIVDLDALRRNLSNETILVSIQQVNGEVGAIQPLVEAAQIVKSYHQDILFHTDGVQGFAKIPLYPKRLGIDLYSAGAHKIHGPKGVGFLYAREKVKIKPQMYGGQQQNNVRSGTENVPGIAGFGLAARRMMENLAQNKDHVEVLRNHFIQGLSRIEDVIIHGASGEEQSPFILSVGFAGVPGEVLLHALEEKGIYVSAGSACASNRKTVSPVLQGMGVATEYLESTLRFSFSEFNTKEEIDYTLETLYNCVPLLRKFTRR